MLVWLFQHVPLPQRDIEHVCKGATPTQPECVMKGPNKIGIRGGK